MGAERISARETGGRPAMGWLPQGADLVLLAMLGLGLAALYGPTYWDLAHTVWASDEQGHGPIILSVSLWLMFQRRHALADLPYRPVPVAGWALLALARLCYVFGRTQAIILLEV